MRMRSHKIMIYNLAMSADPKNDVKNKFRIKKTMK